MTAEREFPSDKVYRRDDRGIVGVGAAARVVTGLPPLLAARAIRPSRFFNSYEAPITAALSTVPDEPA